MGQLLEVLGSRERRELERASGGPLGDVTEERDRSGPHSLTTPATPVGASRRVREVRHRPGPPNSAVERQVAVHGDGRAADGVPLVLLLGRPGQPVNTSRPGSS